MHLKMLSEKAIHSRTAFFVKPVPVMPPMAAHTIESTLCELSIVMNNITKLRLREESLSLRFFSGRHSTS